MSDPVQLALIALIATIPPTVVGLMSAWLTYLGNKKVDAVAKTTDKISVATDGTLSTTTKLLEVSQAKNEGLREVITTQNAAKDVADALAASPPKQVGA